MIYFVKDGDFVKIGHINSSLDKPWWRKDLRNRVVGMSNGNPRDLDILGVIRGSRFREHLLHQIFEADHHRGEWFRCSERLLSFISRSARKAPKEVYKRIGYRRVLTQGIA